MPDWIDTNEEEVSSAVQQRGYELQFMFVYL